MSKQLYDTGDVIQAGANALEVTGVTYQEVDGEKVKFGYTLRLQSEVEAERVAEAQHQKAQEVAAKEAKKLESNTKPADESDDE